MDLILFYGIVSLLPMFFLYQMYRDVSKKKARRRELTKYFKASGTGNGNLKDAVKLVDDLDSIVPGARQAAIRRIVKSDTKGVETIITVLDVPYYRSRIKGFVLTQPEFNGTIIIELYPFLIRALAEIGRSSVQKLKGVLQAKPAVEKVIATLRDSEAGVREMGIRALIKINDVRALPALENLAHTDQTVIDDRPLYTVKDLAEDAIKLIRKNNPVT